MRAQEHCCGCPSCCLTSNGKVLGICYIRDGTFTCEEVICERECNQSCWLLCHLTVPRHWAWSTANWASKARRETIRWRISILRRKSRWSVLAWEAVASGKFCYLCPCLKPIPRVLENSSSRCCSNPNEGTLLLCISVCAVSVDVLTRAVVLHETAVLGC